MAEYEIRDREGNNIGTIREQTPMGEDHSYSPSPSSDSGTGGLSNAAGFLIVFFILCFIVAGLNNKGDKATPPESQNSYSTLADKAEAGDYNAQADLYNQALQENDKEGVEKWLNLLLQSDQAQPYELAGNLRSNGNLLDQNYEKALRHYEEAIKRYENNDDKARVIYSAGKVAYAASNDTFTDSVRTLLQTAADLGNEDARVMLQNLEANN